MPLIYKLFTYTALFNSTMLINEDLHFNFTDKETETQRCQYFTPCYIAHGWWKLCLPDIRTFSLFNSALLLCMTSFHSFTVQWGRPHYCHFKNKERTSERWVYEGHTVRLPCFDSIFIHKVELFHLWEIYWRSQIKLNVIKKMQEEVKSWLIESARQLWLIEG